VLQPFLNKFIMKKQFLLILTILFYSPLLSAQVLYHETFDNLTLGDITNDPSGTTPGQGNWYVKLIGPATAKIVTEPGKGNVLAIENGYSHVSRGNLQTVWNNRTVGNNILLAEYDFYADDVENSSRVWLFASDNAGLIDMLIHTQYNSALQSKEAVLYAIFPAQGTSTQYDQKGFNYTKKWLNIKVYVDYNTYKLYIHIPQLNILHAVSIKQVLPLNHIAFVSSLQKSFSGPFNKYDNIKITALKNVPPEVLSTNTFLSEKFNLFPNPASNVVNISNSENRIVNKVDIYDVTGKLINTQKFNNETEIQLNVEALNSGTYLLHLQTNEGIGVKKLVKK